MTSDDLVRKNLEVSIAGLRQVREALIASGLVAALPGYRRLLTVLKAQRALAMHDRNMDVLWAGVCQEARQTSEVLTNFAEVLDQIAAVSAMIDVPQVPITESEGDAI